jgi:hypothetical protein
MLRFVIGFILMLERDRKRWGISTSRMAWLLGMTVREYRELEAGERVPDFDTCDRIDRLFGWPRSFVPHRAVRPTEMTDELRSLLEELDPGARAALRQALIRGQADRDAIASRLLRYGDEIGGDWADIVDLLTLHSDVSRSAVRLLGEIDAAEPCE